MNNGYKSRYKISTSGINQRFVPFDNILKNVRVAYSLGINSMIIYIIQLEGYYGIRK